MWHRLSGAQLKLTLEETLLADISKISEKLKFYIGSDSHYSNNKVVYSVVLVLLKEGRGGLGYYKRIHDKGKITTPQRLFQETSPKTYQGVPESL